MNILLNGQEKECTDGSTVLELLASLKLTPESVVVEHNHEILQPEAYTAAELAENDQVEIIRFVGGG